MAEDEPTNAAVREHLHKAKGWISALSADSLILRRLLGDIVAGRATPSSIDSQEIKRVLDHIEQGVRIIEQSLDEGHRLLLPMSRLPGA